MGKGSLYEGGVRVPLLLRWPGHIPPGSHCDAPVSLADLFPTLCDAVGTKLDPAYPRDGVSLRPLFSGGKIPDRTIFIHYPHYFATSGTTPTRVAIQDRYKLFWNPYDHIEIEGARIHPDRVRYIPKPRLELYDVQADPGEKVNLAEKMPDKLKELCRLYEAWMKQVGAKELAPNPDYDAKDPLFNEREAALGNAG
jgi:arylsulfatase A-like enzyme